MKKKSLLLMLLMALLVPWAANAQETLTVYGDNTTTNEYVPIYGYYADSKSKCEFIIPSEKISAMNGSVISAMKFYLDHSDDGSYYSTISAPFEVFVKEVSATTLSGFVGNSGATTVFNGTITIGLGESGLEIDIPFSSDYIYGGGNLLVGFYQTTTTGYNHTYWTGETQTTNTAWGGYVGSASAKKFLPKTTFTYEFITTPTITLPPTATVKTGLTTELTATLMNVTGTPTIIYSSSNSKVASVTGSGTTATVTGVSAGTATITATMVYNATNYYATCDVTVEDPSYCTPTFGNPSDDYIANFATTGGATNIDNTTTYETGGYSNYYEAVSASIEAGETLSCTVTPSSTSYDYGHAIWVDWNKNYEFEASERVAYSTAAAAGNWTGEFEVPVTTAAGDYRLRVLHVYNYNNVTDPCLSANYGEGEDYKLTVTAANPYQKPVNLQVSALTATTATLTWEAPNSNVLSYKYQYQPDGGTWTDLTTTTALSAPLPALTGNTAYNFQVQAIYAGGNESAFASTSFTTPCDAFSIDPIAYQYGFEDVSDMDCWTLTNVTNGGVGSNSWASSNLGYEPARTGTNFWVFLYVDYDNTDPQYQTLISPELTDIPANGVHVEFYYVKDLGGSGAESFRVGYSTTDKNLSSFTWGTEITNASTEYQRFSANYPQETKYVAVQHTSDDQYYLFLDDFTFEGAADCLEPSDVLADNITTTSADITWTAGGEETAWDIYVTDDSTIVPDDGTTPTYANVSTKPYPLSLNPATTYYVYVRAACKGTETSAWSTPGIFHTECEGMDLPYGPYGFEDGALSVCWNVINTNTSYNSVTVSNSNPNTGTHSLDFYRGSYDGDLVAVLPEVGAYDLSDYQFEFSAKGGYAGYEITIGIMTDPDDFTTFVAQGDVITTTTSYAEHKVRFNEYTGTGKYVAISVVRPTSVTYGRIYVDDIAINPIPSCIEPTGLAVSDETAHGATFGWTAGGSETEWHLYVSTENNAPADDINLKEVYVADSNPFTLTTGLDPETDYYVWVRANCGSTDGYSPWVGPETFTTEVACPAPTGLAASEITGHTAKLSWTGTSDSYNVWYRTAATMSNPIFSETFETSSLPTGWGRSSTALTDDVLNGTTTINSYSGGWVNTSYGLGQYNWKMNIYSTGKYWLITPSITLDAKNTLNFDAAITAYNSNNAPTSSNMANANSRFVVLITTDNQATWTILREWNNTGSADVLNNISNTGNNFSIDLTAYAGETVKIAFYGGQTSSGPDCDLHIDNVVIGTPVEAGEWTKKTADASPYVATVLLAETKYEAKVQGNCGSEGTSQWSSSIFFTTDIACPAPTALAASNPTSSSFDISWNNGGAEDWIVAYKVDGVAYFTEVSVNISEVTEEAGLITYTLGGLDPETDYIVKVCDNCEASIAGDGYSAWTDEVAYSTVPSCSALNPVVDPASITHHDATVNFDGESATGFNVYYRTAAGINASFSETFNAATLPTGWDKSNTPLTDDVLAGTTTITAGYQYGWYSTSYGLGQYNWKMNIYSTNKYWLITPSITIGTNNILNFDAAITKYNDNIAPTTTNMADANSRFVVLITTDDMATWTILREWNNTGSADVLNNISNTGNNFTIDLSSYKDETVKIAFYGHQGSSGPDCDLHIDNVMVGVATTPGAWETEAATGTTADLTDLTAGTKYDLKVVPNCDPTLETDIVNFTTLSSDTKYFLTEGEWETAANWMDGEIPTSTDDAIIHANVTVPNGTNALANNINLQNGSVITVAAGASLTINGTVTNGGSTKIIVEDGGQLIHKTSIYATVKKYIKAPAVWKGTSDADGWYLIATPVSSTNISSTFDGTITIDLFKYNEATAYWWSYNNGNHTFNSMTRGTGYLHASQTSQTVSYAGSMISTESAETISLSYAYDGSSTDVKGFNLVGNPFTRNLVLGNMSIGSNPVTTIYVIKAEDRTKLTAVTTDEYEVKPGEGFFVQATAVNQMVKLNPSAKDEFEFRYIKIVAGNENGSDNAYIQLENGNTLRKMNIAKKTSVYVIDNGDDYAAATIHELAGTMPVHFKAVAEGEYDITVSTKNLEATTLLLFDNFKNETIDLLETPTYSFKSSADDPENRFKLIFDFNNNNNYNGVEDNFTNGNFVYQSGDELIVNGEGELQIFDVLGRLVTSKNISGIERISKPEQTGVYIFRLNEHTQKLIIK